MVGREVRFDGLMTLLTASALHLAAGEHVMTFAIADVGDGRPDSAVFIEAATFSTATALPILSAPTDAGTFAPTAASVPEPGTLLLVVGALAGLWAAGRRNNGRPALRQAAG